MKAGKVFLRLSMNTSRVHTLARMVCVFVCVCVSVCLCLCLCLCEITKFYVHITFGFVFVYNTQCIRTIHDTMPLSRQRARPVAHTCTNTARKHTHYMQVVQES
jgi:hypothetical protein